MDYDDWWHCRSSHRMVSRMHFCSSGYSIMSQDERSESTRVTGCIRRILHEHSDHGYPLYPWIVTFSFYVFYLSVQARFSCASRFWMAIINSNVLLIIINDTNWKKLIINFLFIHFDTSYSQNEIFMRIFVRDMHILINNRIFKIEVYFFRWRIYEILCARRHFATGRFRNQSNKFWTLFLYFSNMYFDQGIAWGLFPLIV